MVARSKRTWTPRLVALTQDECLALLASKRVGRVAWYGVRGPQVIPTAYSLIEGDIVLYTSPSSPIERALFETQTAFQVDDIDESLAFGWSVLVVGEATYVGRPTERLRPREKAHRTWASDVRNLCIRIHPARITGRRLRS